MAASARDRPTACRSGVASIWMPRPKSPATCAISASPGRTCRRCCEATRGPITATTSSTRAASTRRGAAPTGLDAFAAAARAAGLGILIDIVPNHMGIAQPRAEPVVVGRPDPRPRFALRRGVRHRLGLRRRQGARADPRRAARRGARPGRCDRSGDDAPHGVVRYSRPRRCPDSLAGDGDRRRSTIRATCIARAALGAASYWRREATPS